MVWTKSSIEDSWGPKLKKEKSMSDKPVAPGYLGTGSNKEQEKQLKEHFPPPEKASGDGTKADPKPWWKFW